MKVVLASGSPRRKELLGNIFDDFEVIPSTVEENIEFTNVEDYVKELAFIKAKDVFDMIKNSFSNSADSDLLVIGSDTVVYNDGKVLGKPADEEDAKMMIRSLAGKKHQVYTGVCLIKNIKNTSVKTFSVKTDVYVDDISDKEIELYVATGDPLDKAGSYGIQDDYPLINRIEGSYYNVMGLPVEDLTEHVFKR